MKKLFKSIRNREIETVKQIIEKRPELVNCIAKQPPKKDDGQSPLQVAFKTGNIDIAEYLIDMGAIVNFIEDESCCNSWRTPVLHDAINCAVMCCRWNTNDEVRGFKVYSTKEKADEALRLLKKMIDAGADVNAVDSHGNSGLNRFGLQANQILPPYNYVEHIEGNSRIFTDDVHMDLRNVLQVLKDAGADVNYKAPNIGYSVRDFYREGSISVLFDEVFGRD
jgi:hypothetical protein